MCSISSRTPKEEVDNRLVDKLNALGEADKENLNILLHRGISNFGNYRVSSLLYSQFQEQEKSLL